MEKLQIIRLPKKYADIVQILTLEEKGRLLDAILYYETKEIKLEWNTKTLFDLIKVDLDNLHKKASAWTKGWRPIKPKVIEITKPKVIENDNLKKRKEEKGRESNVIFKKYIEEHKDTNLTSILINKLLLLWYNPSKDETIETFKQWFTWFNIPVKDCKGIIEEFYEYWNFEIQEWRVKKSKNWKLTFSNNFKVKWYGN